jgi:hypothetical protein
VRLPFRHTGGGDTFAKNLYAGKQRIQDLFYRGK